MTSHLETISLVGPQGRATDGKRAGPEGCGDVEWGGKLGLLLASWVIPTLPVFSLSRG